MASMPDVLLPEESEAAPVGALGRRLIALYCTHSDESYIEGDGTESKEEKGGIYDIAALFAEKLENLGAAVELNTATHHPHDAGAYRRSRQTALSLLKKQPNGIFDLHRDGIPDPDEYAATIGGRKMSKVRLLVGKSNQNKDANMAFAKQIKAVADKLYPGLIKDIYMGKGTYNQDIAPRSVLLEFGTHTLPKERVEASAGPMADVITKTLFGGVVGSAGSSDVSGTASQNAEKPATESNEGAGAAVWIILALVLGLGAFSFLAAGRGGVDKWKHSFSEMTGGLIGKRPKKQ
jgi:stage II sporulation protein P